MPGATRRSPDDPENATPAAKRVRTTKRTAESGTGKQAAKKAAAKKAAAKKAAAKKATAKKATAKKAAGKKAPGTTRPTSASQAAAAAQEPVPVRREASTRGRPEPSAATAPAPAAAPGGRFDVRPQTVTQAFREQVGGAAADAADTVQAKVHDLADYVRQRGSRTTADRLDAVVERLRETRLTSRPVAEWPAAAQDLVRDQPLAAASISAATGFAAAGALAVARHLGLGRLLVGAAAGAAAVRGLSRREGSS